jgi:hypothetical protein
MDYCNLKSLLGKHVFCELRTDTGRYKHCYKDPFSCGGRMKLEGFMGEDDEVVLIDVNYKYPFEVLTYDPGIAFGKDLHGRHVAVHCRFVQLFKDVEKEKAALNADASVASKVSDNSSEDGGAGDDASEGSAGDDSDDEDYNDKIERKRKHALNRQTAARRHWARAQHQHQPERITDDAVNLGFRRINRLLNQLHEHAAPKFTSAERASMNTDGTYGGITGAIRCKGMRRIFEGLGLRSERRGAADARGVKTAEAPLKRQLRRDR